MAQLLVFTCLDPLPFLWQWKYNDSYLPFFRDHMCPILSWSVRLRGTWAVLPFGLFSKDCTFEHNYPGRSWSFLDPQDSTFLLFYLFCLFVLLFQGLLIHLLNKYLFRCQLLCKIVTYLCSNILLKTNNKYKSNMKCVRRW